MSKKIDNIPTATEAVTALVKALAVPPKKEVKQPRPPKFNPNLPNAVSVYLALTNEYIAKYPEKRELVLAKRRQVLMEGFKPSPERKTAPATRGSLWKEGLKRENLDTVKRRYSKKARW